MMPSADQGLGCAGPHLQADRDCADGA